VASYWPMMRPEQLRTYCVDPRIPTETDGYSMHVSTQGTTDLSGPTPLATRSTDVDPELGKPCPGQGAVL